MGFCTASALHKENVLEQNTLQAINLQRLASTETTLPSTSDDGVEKPKTTRKRATKKNDTSKLKLDKKPAVRKPRKKKDQVVEEVQVTIPAKDHTPLGDLQIFEYKSDTEKDGSEATLKPKPTKPRNTRDESDHKLEGLQGGNEASTAVRTKGTKPLSDLQIFEYKPDAEEGGKDPVTKTKTGRSRRKKGEPQQNAAQKEDQVDAAVHSKEVTPLGNLAVFEYAPGAQVIGDETATKPKPRKPRTKKSQPASKPDAEPQEDKAVVGDLLGADHTDTNPDTTILPTVVVKVRKPRQPRKDKATTEDQTEIKAKVTKPRTNAKAGKKVQQENVQAGADVVEISNTTDHITSEIPTTTTIDVEPQISEDLALAPALKRRRSWTPPRITKTPHDEDLDDDASLVQEDENMLAPPTTFLNLKGSFGYNEQTVRDEGSGELAKSDEPVLKRRRIEVTKVPKVPKKKASPEKKAPKPKAPRAPPKAVRTVTGIALANFQHQDSEMDQAVAPMNIQTLLTEGAGLAEPVDAGTAAIKSAIKRKRSVSPAKRASLDGPGPTKTKKSTKKVTLAVPQKLLSPVAAQKRLEKQDILFGTSSQLAREDSPTFLRELQQAIKASESQAMEESQDEVVPAMRRKSLSNLQATRKLWSVGARDDEMKVLKPESPLSERRSLMMAEAAMLPMDDIPLMNDLPLMNDISRKDGIPLDDPTIDHVRAENVSNIAQQANSQHIDLISSDAFQDIDTIAGLPQQPAIYAEVISSPPSAQHTTRSNVLQDLSTNKKLNLTATRFPLDDNKAPPSSQRASERARSHSPKKSTLFDAVQPTTAPTIETIPRKSPKRASTAPIILTSSPYHHIDDIEDSEPELTSSPPRPAHLHVYQRHSSSAPAVPANVNAPPLALHLHHQDTDSLQQSNLPPSPPKSPPPNPPNPPNPNAPPPNPNQPSRQRNKKPHTTLSSSKLSQRQSRLRLPRRI